MKIIPNSRILRAGFILLSALFIFSCSTLKWESTATDDRQMLSDISFLASNKLKGRTFGSPGEVKAGDYIAGRFQQLGLQPKGENGTWFQALSVKNPNPHTVEFSKNSDSTGLHGRNVIGYIDHKAPLTIILGAHYDHLGMGTFGSLGDGKPAIHNGADDNASGVGMILELAERLRANKNFNYLFIAFTGEENGLWGSNYFTEHPTIDFKDVTAMLNFDMVGRLNPESKLAINGVGTSPVWPDLIKSSNTFGFDITSSESGIGPSDHSSFYVMDMPVLHFFTGSHEDYHKPSDDVDKINSTGMVRIANLVVAMISGISNKEKLQFTKTKDADPSSTPKLEVTLGVLPDYLYDGTGLRLDGVRDGKPAQIAGMKKGDIITHMAGKDIKDIYAYMAVLGTFHKGDKIKVTALRGGKEMEFDISF
ncbi:MAG: M28 family peptidase [Saprospiraceae bacterium]